MILYKRPAFTSRWAERYQEMRKSIADDTADIILRFGRGAFFLQLDTVRRMGSG